LRKSVEEIKKLQEEVSALRQENIQLKVRKYYFLNLEFGAN
jgi:hypothetical protein